MGKININYQNGGIGGLVPSTDFISGFIFDSVQVPSGFASNDRIKVIYSLQDAVNLGITNTSIGETKATGGNIAITTNGAAGDYINLYITPAYGVKTLIGSYTVKISDTIGTATTGLVNNINLLTASTGWTAEELTDGSIDLIPPVGYGASLNGANVITAEHKSGTTFVTSITNFSGGAGSEIDLMYYTIQKYFNANSTSKLYIGIYDFTSAYDASKIAAIQTYAQGEIRQLGIWTKKGLNDIVSIINATQIVCTDQTNKHKPLSVVLGLQPGSITSVNNLIAIRSLTARQVSVTVSNEYGLGKVGYALKGKTGVFPTDLGSVIGHISRSKVSNSIAWVQQNVTEYAETMLVTGETWNSIADTTIDTELDNKGYIFQRSYIGSVGNYFNNDSVADAFTSDYDSIKRSRVMDKAARIAYTSLLPYLSSPVIITSSGTISTSIIESISDTISFNLRNMLNNGEVSAYSVFIDPNQQVLVTKNLDVTLTIVPVGSMDTITVNLAYALSIQ